MMARIVKEEEYNAKRNEILDVALSLVYSRGYEQMTIQDILDGLKISRGAFYHYFDSKQALLEALVDRMGRELEQALLPIINDPDLSALQKFRLYFETSARWKSLEKKLIIGFMRMWYSDENAIIRQKMTSESIKHNAGMIEPIIRQGIDEKVFTTHFPGQVAEIVAGVALNLSDSIIGLLLSPQLNQVTFQKLEIYMNAYVDTIERIIGAPSGSLKIFEPGIFKEWFVEENPELVSEKNGIILIRRIS
jgi:AcrR family transcriptional regulator